MGRHTTDQWVIYVLEDPRFPGVVRYVGVTHKRPKDRLRDHVRRAEVGKVNYHSTRWIQSLLREGIEPILRVIDSGAGESWALAEVQWIDWYRSQGFDLTNHTRGGEGTLGHKPSAETRLKMSLAKLGKKRSTEAVLKTKETMSTPEYRERHSKVHQGHKASEKARDRMRAAMLGRKQTPEHIEKRAAANRGLKRSPEICAKFSQARRGKKQSPETIAKRVASRRKRK